VVLINQCEEAEAAAREEGSREGVRHDLVQQCPVGDLFPEAEHDSRGRSSEHGGAGVPEQRAVRPHGPESRTEEVPAA